MSTTPTTNTTWTLPDFDDGLDREDEEEEEETEEGFMSRHGKDATLFVVDCAKSMMVPNELGVIPFVEALATVLDTLQSKASRSSTDLSAVMFYNTEKSDPAQINKHIQVPHALEMPTIDTFVELKAYLDPDQGLVKFTKDFGSLDIACPLATVFHSCARVFPYEKAKRKSLASMRVLLFTNDDDPNKHQASVRDATRQRAKDLKQRGIQVEVLGIGTDANPFMHVMFYRDILHDDDEAGMGDFDFQTFKDRNDLMKAMRKSLYPKRTLAQMRWRLFEGCEMAVRMYSLVAETKLNRYSYVDTRTNLNVATVTEFQYDEFKSQAGAVDTQQRDSDIDMETAQMEPSVRRVTVKPSDYQFAYDYGGERVVFSKEEIKAMKSFGNVGLDLLGFKPIESLKAYQNLRPAYFLHPDDQMHAKGRMAVCRMKSRQASLLRLVALLPQAEVLGADGFQQAPPGFHVIVLPYADDVREVPRTPVPTVSNAGVAVMKQVLLGLSTPSFDAHAFPNPVIQRHRTVLQCIALDEFIPEHIPNATEPDSAKFKREEKLFEKLADLLPEDEQPVKPSKRAAPKSEGTKQPAKKKKAAEDAADQDDAMDEVTEALANGTLNKVTVPVLKAYLKHKGIKAVGKKSDLIAAIQNR